MIRGELWTLAGGVYAHKQTPRADRPGRSVRSHRLGHCGPTHLDAGRAPLTRVRVAATTLSGLDVDGDIMVDKVTTVRRRNVLARVGRVTSTQLVEVERSLMTFLGLAR